MKNKAGLVTAMFVLCCLSTVIYAKENDSRSYPNTAKTACHSKVCREHFSGKHKNCPGCDHAIFTDSSCTMTADTVYEIDLEGDGRTEQIFYRTYEHHSDPENCSAVLEIYKNGELFWNCTSPSWSYSWELSTFSLTDGTSRLLAVSKSDNDWTPNAYLLAPAAEQDTLRVLADLTELTRQSEEHPENLLSVWSRILDSPVPSASENTFTVPWLSSLKCTGNLTIYADYEITENSVIQHNAPLRLDEQCIWTSWQNFDVYDRPGSTKTVFHIKPDDTVHLTAFDIVNDRIYLKCVNENGLEGWFPDPEESIYQPSPDNPDEYSMGYFKECVFAG